MQTLFRTQGRNFSSFHTRKNVIRRCSGKCRVWPPSIKTESVKDAEEASPHFAPRLGREFFDVPCVQLAKNLLGQVLVRKEADEEKVLRGRIVETEAYLGGEDRASHTHNGKLTDRTAPAFMQPATMYVSRVYGMYHLFNISSQGEGATVLLRALEPLSGLDLMRKKRSQFGKGSKKPLKEFKLHQICNGPSKLCISLALDTRLSGHDLVSSPELWLEEGPEPVSEADIIHTTRIGVDFAGQEWASKLLRFYILGNSCVSKRDKEAERRLMTNDTHCDTKVEK